MDKHGQRRREHHYRERGWWPGERLEDRYARMTSARPDALAVVDDGGRSLSHRALWDASGTLAEALRERGLEPGDVGLIFIPNRIECHLSFLALLRMGAIPASVPTRTDPESLAYVTELGQVRVILATDDPMSRSLADIARAAASRAPAVPIAFVDGGGGARWEGAIAKAGSGPPGVPGLDHLMFTSSTTGLPKAVMHTSDTLAALNFGFSDRFGLDRDSPIFMPSPLGHSVGAVHGIRLALYNGCALVLQDGWDPTHGLEMVASNRCAFTAAATPFLKDLVDLKWRGQESKLASLRTFLCGGAQVPPTLMEQTAREFPSTFVSALWGMTEGGLTTCLPDSPAGKRLNTCGRGLPGLEISILDGDGRELPLGEEGELSMRGPGVFFGYLAQDDLYQSLMTPSRYFRTGDLARLDDEGYVRITGRIKDLLVRGGVNISPVPIEDAIAAHPDVQAVAVVGYPDERLGDRICAVIAPKEPTPPTLEGLLDFVRAQGLPKRYWPEIIRFRPEFPRTAAGKIRKIELREEVLAADLRANLRRQDQ